MPIVDVICIRWGTLYSFEYVERLYHQVCLNLDIPFNFICYTDQPERMDGITFRPCFEDLEGWYQKLGLFRDGEIKRPTLFLQPRS